MIKFLLYLFESGACLTIFLLVYILFLKKETYFQFNRSYLLIIILFSAVLPLLHINLNTKDNVKYESYFDKIGQIKTSYEYIIALTNTKTLTETSNSNVNNTSLTDKSINNDQEVTSKESLPALRQTTVKKHKWSVAHFIMVIYLLGIIFLMSRFFILFRWILKTIKTSSPDYQDSCIIINVNQNISPFSIFKYIFLNKESLDSEKLNQILDHEQIHIKEKHSVDLILVQLLCVLQWFNPFAWMLLKCIKANHEFIADNSVLQRGYNKLEYQELLLNQFISFPSVNLVNNLNLNNIKNRIKMMNKFKSNTISKLKPLIIIPFALFAFLLFSNLTINSGNSSINNYSIFKNQQIMQLKGMWKNESTNTYGKYLLIENSKFSLLENDNTLREFPYQITDNEIILSLPNKEKAILNYKLTDSQLKIWWGNQEYSVYNKSQYNNTLEEYFASLDIEINLPVMDYYKILKKPELCINVIITNEKYYVNHNEVTAQDLEEAILEAKNNMNKLYEHLITVNIYNDISVPMGKVTELKQILRKSNLLKICYMGIAEDNKVSKLETQFVGVPRMLPPPPGSDKMEVLEIIPDSVESN